VCVCVSDVCRVLRMKKDVKSPVGAEEFFETRGRTLSAGSFDRMSDSQHRSDQ